MSASPDTITRKDWQGLRPVYAIRKAPYGFYDLSGNLIHEGTAQVFVGDCNQWCLNCWSEGGKQGQLTAKMLMSAPDAVAATVDKVDGWQASDEKRGIERSPIRVFQLTGGEAMLTPAWSFDVAEGLLQAYDDAVVIVCTNGTNVARFADEMKTRFNTYGNRFQVFVSLKQVSEAAYNNHTASKGLFAVPRAAVAALAGAEFQVSVQLFEHLDVENPEMSVRFLRDEPNAKRVAALKARLERNPGLVLKPAEKRLLVDAELFESLLPHEIGEIRSRGKVTRAAMVRSLTAANGCTNPRAPYPDADWFEQFAGRCVLPAQIEAMLVSNDLHPDWNVTIQELNYYTGIESNQPKLAHALRVEKLGLELSDEQRGLIAKHRGVKAAKPVSARAERSTRKPASRCSDAAAATLTREQLVAESRELSSQLAASRDLAEQVSLRARLRELQQAQVNGASARAAGLLGAPRPVTV